MHRGADSKTAIRLGISAVLLDAVLTLAELGIPAVILQCEMPTAAECMEGKVLGQRRLWGKKHPGMGIGVTGSGREIQKN